MTQHNFRSFPAAIAVLSVGILFQPPPARCGIIPIGLVPDSSPTVLENYDGDVEFTITNISSFDITVNSITTPFPSILYLDGDEND